MRYRVIMLFAVIALLTTPSALAIGGGGGGGGGFASPITGSSGSASACSNVCDLVCGSNGAITLRSTQPHNLTATAPNGTMFQVAGWWRWTMFTSDELLFNESGVYQIEGSSVVCPGLTFACKQARITIERCTQNGTRIDAAVRLTNTDRIDQLRYAFVTSDDRNLYFTPTIRSGRLDVAVTENDPLRITATYPDPITTIQISDTRCTGRYLVVATAACSDNGTADASERTYRCSDLISMFERVRCRLALTQGEQEAELALDYVPEQCRALDSHVRGRCIALYQSFRTCQNGTSAQRVSCAQRALGLVAMDLGRYCAGRDRPACSAEFRDKIHDLIIFRFYELEEKAEELLAEGRVSLQDAADVITLIEAAKVKFASATSYEERRTIILGVRDIWREFVGVVA